MTYKNVSPRLHIDIEYIKEVMTLPKRHKENGCSRCVRLLIIRC